MCDKARHRRDIVDEIEIEFVVESGVERISRNDQKQRVAVGRRMHHRVSANVAAGAWPVLNNERLAKTL